MTPWTAGLKSDALPECLLRDGEKPEIMITREMEEAGVFAYSTCMMATKNDHIASLKAAYRAMRSVGR